MIGDQFQGGSVDEVAVRRDDELLGLLGRRTAPREVDAAAALLWALTLDVDREDLGLALDPVSEDRVGGRRATTATTRHGARGTVIGVVVAATLSVSGVAAAVTGDPLSPYLAVISLGQDDDPPAPRRGKAPAVVRQEGTTTGRTGGVVAAPDLVLGRVAVTGALTNKAAGKPSDRSRGRAAGTTGRPESPGRSAGRASASDAASAAKAAEAAKVARAAKPGEADSESREPARGEKGAQPQRTDAGRPETKEQREKP